MQNQCMIDARLITLRTFAQCGTVAATAQLMGYSASAVSAQLRELQRALGMTLLAKDGRGLRLTATGRDLVRRSDVLITTWEEVRSAALTAGGHVPTHFGIGGFSTAASQLLAPLASRLLRTRPELEVRVWEASPARCFDLLVAEHIDVAVVVSMQGQVHLEEDPRFEKMTLLDDPLDVMVPSDHAVAGRDSVELEELVGERWITDQPGSPYHALFTAAFTTAGLSPRISHEAIEWETAISLVGAGVGVGLLPRLASLEGVANVSRVRLTGAERLSRKVIAAVRAGSLSSPLQDESIRILREISQGILATRLEDEVRAEAR